MLKAAPKALKWLLPIVVIVSLLASLGYYITSSAPALAQSLTNPPPVLAQDDGEQSAQILPDDIEIYLSINLDEIDLGGFIAGEGDLAAIWDNWAEGLGLSGLDPGYWLGQLELPEWVDIDDILALFGPELALGVRDIVPAGLEGQPPELIVLLGTENKDASDYLFFNHILPEMTGLEPEALEGAIELYNDDIDILLFEDVYGMDMHLAFPTDWVIFYIASPDQGGALFYDTLDLILNSTPPSLAGEPNFIEAQENLPPDRMCMSYIDIEDILTDALVAFGIIDPGDPLPETIEFPIPIDGMMTIYLHFFYMPDVIAGANSFTENGITSATYYHYPAEMAPPDPGDDLLYSTKIVPADALLFTSGHNPNATWEYICAEIAGAAGEDWAIALDAQIDAINAMLVPYTLDSIFGLMDQELAYALLPVEPYDGGFVPPQLMLIEITDEDMAPTQVMMAGLFAALGLELEEDFTVDGVTAYRPTADSWNGLLDDVGDLLTGLIGGLIGEEIDLTGMPRFGYFFLDDIPTDGDPTNFLVIGFPVEDELNALEAALDAKNGAIPSLDEAADFNAILNMLGVSPGAPAASLSYITFNGILSNIVSLLGEDFITGFAMSAYLMSPLRALGSSTTYITESPEVTGMLTTSAIYINMVEPIVPLSSSPWGQWGQWVGAGTWTTEGGAFLDPLDPDIGYVSVVIEGNNTEAGDVGVAVYKEPSSEAWDGFALAASGAGLSMSDIAYVVDVDAPESTGPATITMTVGCDWVDSQGGPDNIKIFRYSDGTCTMLDTEFVGEEDGVCTFTATSTEGLSTFGLIAAPSPAAAPAGGLNWALIGGIIGGVLAAASIGIAVFFLRRRPRPV